MGFKAHDYTRLVKRENKLWSFSGMALPGLAINRLVLAGAATVVVFAGGLFAATLIKTLWGYALALALSVATAVGVYFGTARKSADKMTAGSSLAVWLDWYRQPRRIASFAHDREPQRIHWQVITWESRNPGWRKAVKNRLSDIEHRTKATKDNRR